MAIAPLPGRYLTAVAENTLQTRWQKESAENKTKKKGPWKLESLCFATELIKKSLAHLVSKAPARAKINTKLFRLAIVSQTSDLDENSQHPAP